MIPNPERPVTKEFLAAFGDRCKQMFRYNPQYLTSSQSSGDWLYIKTDLKYNLGEFDSIYIGVNGVCNYTDNEVVYSTFQAKTNQAGVLNYSVGINFGNGLIQYVIFFKEDDNLTIAMQLPQDYLWSESVVDCFFYKEEQLLHPEIVVSYNSSVPSVSAQSDYEQIYIQGTIIPSSFSKTPIGEILVKSESNTQFYVIKDDLTIDPTAYDSYPQVDRFDSIYKAKEADRLSRDKYVQYDWNTIISDGDSPVVIGDLEDDVIYLPLPNILPSNTYDTDGDYETLNSFIIQNGIIVDAAYDEYQIPLASDKIGGIKIGNQSQTCNGRQIFVQLDSNGQAFVDSENFEGPVYHADLNQIEYTENIANHEGELIQHIGKTNENVTYGYYYKCIRTTGGAQYNSANTIYSIGQDFSTKLYEYLQDNNVSLNFSYNVRISSNPSPYTEIVIDGGTTRYKTLSEVNAFTISNVDAYGNLIGTPININKSELEPLFDVTINLEGDLGSALVKDNQRALIIDITVQYPYSWKQTNVQPAADVSQLLNRITDEQIDYLFETHAESITMSSSAISGDKLDQISISATISPDDVTHNEVIWSTDSTNIIVYEKDIDGTRHDAEVIITNNAEYDAQYVIKCSSVSEPDVYDTCILTVIDPNSSD